MRKSKLTFFLALKPNPIIRDILDPKIWSGVLLIWSAPESTLLIWCASLKNNQFTVIY